MIERIKFSQAYSKLKDNEFTTVRWLDKFYRLGKIYTLVVIGHPELGGRVRLKRLDISKLRYLSSCFTYADADEPDTEKFYQKLKAWYCLKPDWKDWDSEVQILYLKRVQETKKESG